MNSKAITIGAFLVLTLGSALLCPADDSDDIMDSVLAVACKDPCRKIDGKVINLGPRFDRAKAILSGKISRDTKLPLPEWKLVYGKVLQVVKDGLLVQNYGTSDLLMKGEPELIMLRNDRREQHVVDGSPIASYAIRDGRYSYINAQDVRKTIEAWNYGVICSEEEKETLPKPKPVVQPKEIAPQPLSTQTEGLPAIKDPLARDQDSAEKGDADGLLRMGDRYFLGKGVPKDLGKAREYYQKAIDKGSTEAKSALKNLPQ